MLKEITTTEIEATILANPVLREVRAMYREQGAVDKLAVLETQTAKGMMKYGRAVNYKEKTAAEWEKFRLEEEVDGDVYAVCKAMRENADRAQQKQDETVKQQIADALKKLNPTQAEKLLKHMENKMKGGNGNA